MGYLEREGKKGITFPKHLNWSFDIHVYSEIQKFPGSPSGVVTNFL